MSYSVWAANKSVSGGALIAKLTYDNSLLISFFKQIANNADKKNNFDFKNGINIKFSEDEVGDLIRAVRTNGEAKFFHSFEGNKTNGGLRYYSIPAEGEKPGRQGFGFSVTKGENTVKVGLSLGAAERFAEFLRFCLNKAFEAGFIEDLARDKEFRDKMKNKPTNQARPTETNETPPTTTASTEDIDF